MQSRRSVSLLLAALVLLAGCSLAPPADDPDENGRDVRVHVSNDHDRAYVVTIGVAPPDHRGFAVEFVNGTVREYPNATDLQAVPPAAIARAVSVRPIGDNVQTRTYRFDGPQGSTAVFEGVPRNATIYDSIAYPTGDEPMRSVGRVTCGPEASFAEVSIRINPEGVIAVSNHCTDD